jgi:hypothetical protein
MLAYRLEKLCSAPIQMDGRKRPNGRATGDDLKDKDKAS